MKTIATHNGQFHADDTVGVAILQRIYAMRGHDVRVIRTRDPRALDAADVVVDVGGVYDAETRRYDHHQAGRAGARPSGVMYAGAGLVWKHHGHDYLTVDGIDPADIAAVWERVDARFIAAIDAVDNGQALVVGGEAAFPGVQSLGFSSLVSSLNPTWVESASPDELFGQAVDLAEIALHRAIVEALGHVKAADIVSAAVATQGDPTVLVLEKFVPWAEHIHAAGAKALFVVFPDQTGTWMCQAVPDSPGSFGKRKPLPEAWAGKRDAAFQELTDVGDGVFCHPGLFICGAKSLGGALRLAGMAVAA